MAERKAGMVEIKEIIIIMKNINTVTKADVGNLIKNTKIITTVNIVKVFIKAVIKVH